MWFSDQEIAIDGYTFVRCRFDNCTIYVKKGTFSLERCFFGGCRFNYQDESLRVVKLFNILLPTNARFWGALAPEFHEDGTLSIPWGS
jgi:hypothetical protein